MSEGNIMSSGCSILNAILQLHHISALYLSRSHYPACSVLLPLSQALQMVMILHCTQVNELLFHCDCHSTLCFRIQIRINGIFGVSKCNGC